MTKQIIADTCLNFTR